jgi:hypothetical protein
VNSKLPLNLQISRPTPHSGRRTLISSSINNGIDSSIVAKVSQHRDPKSLNGYLDVIVEQKMKAGITIGINKKRRMETLSSDEYDDEGEGSSDDSDDNSRSNHHIKRRK